MRIFATAKAKAPNIFARTIQQEVRCRRNTAFLLRQRGWADVPDAEAQKLFDAGYAFPGASDPKKAPPVIEPAVTQEKRESDLTSGLQESEGTGENMEPAEGDTVEGEPGDSATTDEETDQ